MNIAEYLVRKLEELGITDFFGLPGDYNFNILYAIENNPKTNWIGCTNELNAGYAADGYAREKGFGALVTTYGVGELSAMNAIAGSFSENVPVIHIVGVPSTKCIAHKTRVHHNFQEVEPFAFTEAFKNVTETTAFVNRSNAKLEIDRVLKIFVKERRPVYIAIPIDIAKMEVADKPVDYNWLSNAENLSIVVNLILEKIRKSQNPVILGDTLIKRFACRNEYKNFVEKSGIPATNFLMGTNILDFELKNNLGTYFAGLKNPTAQKLLENTDCLIAVGAIYSDLNSFGFNLPYKINSHIAIYGTHTYVDGIRYNDIKMSDVLVELSKVIEPREISIEKTFSGYEKTPNPEGKLTSDYVFSRLQEYLKEDDILIAETGIIPQGVAQIKFPSNVELVTQTLWGAIGWATPATLGTCIASKDKRVILFTGEGSHQLTALELGSMLRYGIKPIVIVLNNNGYSIERVLSENFSDEFNDIMQMNYSKFARAFEGDVWSIKVETQEDFDKALRVTQIMNRLCYIEACIAPDDVPELTKKMIESFKTNMKTNEPASIPELYCEKSGSEITRRVINFETKIHESLKD
ncbi:alpha-keto acid decarboxylase family protein [bacterium]|nr:alpha-keto acid decarboxylase family protein [bacterium]